jgi:hypothetical protein
MSGCLLNNYGVRIAIYRKLVVRAMVMCVRPIAQRVRQSTFAGEISRRTTLSRFNRASGAVLRCATQR